MTAEIGATAAVNCGPRQPAALASCLFAMELRPGAEHP
jgi:hypothetical protein